MPIKTPDQKLRVFISSTIDELAEERKLARESITKLRLIPVLFEMGARPHPPRDLYRAYLEQSQIFIGFYWNSYGWIAPDMNISGIEDEFILSEGKPRLIYVKQPAHERHPRLDQLLDTIRQSDSACYQKFSTLEELKELIEDDLAVLLSEKFEADNVRSETTIEKRRDNLPITRDKIIGREDDLRMLKQILAKPEVGLITLTGPGGTGKTRLSLQLLYEIKDEYKDGVYFISLASIADPVLVPATIAHELGLFDSGKQPILDTLVEYLSDKKTILVLDNFEQVTDAIFFVNKILDHCASIKIIVTSRTPLHLRNEWLFPLSPLSNATNEVAQSELQNYPAVQLFIQRAKEINPNLNLDVKNLEVISAICKRLDGLPLAIELAAARTKFFPPVVLLDKMKKMLDLLSQGPKDLPIRQQTMRATIDWSINLLDESQQCFFRRLSVFSSSWSLEASEAVASWDQPAMNVMDATERLIDLGLIASYSHELGNEGIEIRFRMLETVKEYAFEILNKNNELKKTKEQHTEYFVAKSTELQSTSWAMVPYSWFDKEYENLRLAFSDSLRNEKLNYCWQIFGTLGQAWLRQGGFTEAFDWMKLANIKVDIENDETHTAHIDPGIRARAYFSAGMLTYLAGKYDLSAGYLKESVRLFLLTENINELGRAKSFYGLAKINLGDATGTDLTEALELGNKTNDPFTILFASTFYSEALMAIDQHEKARILLDETEKKANEFGSMLGVAMVNLQKGNLYYELNQLPLAVDCFVKSIEQFADSGFSTLSGWSYLHLGAILTELKRIDEARMYLEKGLANARERGEKSMLLADMIYFSLFFLAIGENSKAIRIFSGVQALKTNINTSEWSINKLIDDKIAHLVNSLNDPACADDVAMGKQFSLEELIAYVLQKNKNEMAA
jgi:predicted ATPase